MRAGAEKPTHMRCVWTDRYPILSLREECALEASEKMKSGIGSMGWKEA